jgi:hypothetical protein
MKFGELKTLVENKLTSSFANKELRNDVKIFKKILKEDSSFAKMMNNYDVLNENKGLSNDVASFLFDETISETKFLKIKESTINKIKNWAKGIKSENNYKNIDDFIFSKSVTVEEKFQIKKTIVEGLTKKIVKKDSPNVPISMLVNAANNTIKKHIESLNEEDKTKVLQVLKSDETLKENYNSLKENTIKKIETLISESDDSVKNVLVETKNKIEKTEYSKQEYLKLLTLSEGLVK